MRIITFITHFSKLQTVIVIHICLQKNHIDNSILFKSVKMNYFTSTLLVHLDSKKKKKCEFSFIFNFNSHFIHVIISSTIRFMRTKGVFSTDSLYYRDCHLYTLLLLEHCHSLNAKW